MKLNSALATGVLAVMTALALTACATSDTLSGAEPRRITTPHSHLQEKHGILPRALETMPDRPNAALDRTKHFHPRDGK